MDEKRLRIQQADMVCGSIERAMSEAFDARFWQSVHICREKDSERERYRFVVSGYLDRQRLEAAFADHRSELIEQMIPKHAKELVAKLSKQRWIGPYRWRK